ncbi:MAG: alpha/beta fold hydrolase [Chloroflexi bacterium]|nr:alpha/beta fold hydrolase [Chloroflexota bacterium]
MKETPVTITSQEVTLEGVLTIPDGRGPVPGAVVCHPHPLYGGCMDNGVVAALCHALAEHSVACLRFNFRGVGKSQGHFGQGLAEQHDVLAALSYLATEPAVDPECLAVAGYSFGARIAITVAPKDGRIRAVALVSPPVAAISPSVLDGWHKPKLLVIGSRDDFILPDEFRHFVHDLSEPKSYEVFEGVDHFWWGRENEVGQRLASFLSTCLRRPARRT